MSSPKKQSMKDYNKVDRRAANRKARKGKTPRAGVVKYAPFDHASNPRARKKARDGERKMDNA